MSVAAIEAFYRGNVELIEFLLANEQLSYASDAADNFRRSLVIAIGSFFEGEISDIVRQLPFHHANGNAFLTSLIERKAVSRQYHTYFDWENSSANSFFSMFGAEYKAACQRKLNDEPSFKSAVQAFLSLGATRNQIAHKNYVSFNVDKTPEDIVKEFRQALTFVEYVRASLLPPKQPNSAEQSGYPAGGAQNNAGGSRDSESGRISP
ncbi:MAG TPA: HEPN domain-containing protein [Aliidongia sp.]|nr:HEPN domain-containing protein [Aliidongia sp.]